MTNKNFITDNILTSSILNDFNVAEPQVQNTFNRVIRLAKSLFDMPYAYIDLLDENGQWISAIHDDIERDVSSCQHFLDKTLVINTPRAIEDTLVLPQFSQLDDVVNFPFIRSYVGIPLACNGQVIGLLCALDIKPREIKKHQLDLLTDLACMTESVLNVNQLAVESDGLNNQKKALSELSTKLQSKDQLNDLRSHALELVAQATPIKSIFHAIIADVEREFPKMMCSILLLDDNGQFIEKGYAPSLPDFYNEAINGLEIGNGVGSCGTAAATGKRVVVSNINTHPYWAPFLPLAQKANLGACWSEPIINNEGKVCGTFAIYHNDPCEPQDNEFRLIEQSAHLASIAIERFRANRLIWQQANYDVLTGLPNRELSSIHINVAINNAKRNKQKFSLMFIDLDRFKEVNDTLGHDVGDLLLVEAAARLISCVRESDSVARLGGDEFVILLINIDDKQGGEKIAENILHKLAKPFNLEDDIAYISASIGITTYPDDGEKLEILMKNADQAMYRAKESGRDRYHHYTHGMRALANERKLFIDDLRMAINDNQLVLHYQPIMNIHTNEMSHVEALVRWNHPTKGILYPLDFIELSEDSGLIFSLTQWVLLGVIKQVRKWDIDTFPPFKISINTSSLQYTDNGRHSDGWFDIFDENKDITKYIILEVSEKLLVEPQPYVVDKINELRKYGLEIAIDDFGTGYSPLVNIKKFNIDYLKIDKKLIHQLTEREDSQALFEAMIVMAKKLGTKVVATGIENVEQLSLLSSMGCEFGQGFYLSSPMTEFKLKEKICNEVSNSFS